MIDWKEGAVCYADGKQWKINTSKHGYHFMAINHLDYCDLKFTLSCEDFQLNEPKEGYYIPKSELDTEEKYNQAVEVFGLFGCKLACSKQSYQRLQMKDFYCVGIIKLNLIASRNEFFKGEHKLTFNQLMAIGELKRKTNEREWKGAVSKALSDSVNIFAGITDNHIYGGNTSELPNSSKPAKKRKAKEAYRILESMGIEWDNAERKWFKVSKEWL